MTRIETIATLTAKLGALDDERLQAVIEIVEDISSNDMMRPLAAREIALLEQSRADFKEGRTLSLDEARARTDAYLAERRSLRT